MDVLKLSVVQGIYERAGYFFRRDLAFRMKHVYVDYLTRGISVIKHLACIGVHYGSDFVGYGRVLYVYFS